MTQQTELTVLPRFIALHRGERYLRFVEENGEKHGHFQLNEANLVTPYTKFELQRSEKGGNLMNIRSCYNNKFLVRKNRTEPWVVGEADEPEEDTNKWNCTLFDVAIHINRNPNAPIVYRFIHVTSGTFLGTVYPVDGWRDMLHLASNGLGTYEAYRITNMDSLVILPRYVTFKGHNGLYLSSRVPMFRPQVQFASSDKFDPTIRYEIVIQSDGTFCIKSLHFNNRFLRRAEDYHNWLVTEAASMDDPDTRFEAVQVNRNRIAIRSVRNNRFCTAVQGVPLANCLNASREEIDRFCLMEVEEVVSSRRIYDVVFRTEDARIYNQSDGISLVKTVNNPTLSQQDGNVSFAYTQTKRSTWNVSHGWSVSVSTSITTGIPVLLNGNISIESSYSGQYSWGETISETSQDVSSTNTIIPPMTKSVVTSLLTRGAIDVPFSYTQHDTLYSGQPDIRRLHDGVFTGENTHIYSDAVEYILPSTTVFAEDDDQNLSSTTAVTKDDDDGQYLSSTTTVTKDDDDQNLSSATAVTREDDDQNLSSATAVTKDDDDGQNLSSAAAVTKDDDNDDQQTLSSTTPVITVTTVTKHDDDEQNLSSTTTE